MEHYPEAYIAYLVEFHATRDYFECHELLEEYWKEHPDDPRAELWVGLIQLAVGAYHERRGNRSGAVKMYAECCKKLSRSDMQKTLGIDQAELIEQLGMRLKSVKSITSEEYEDLQLVFVDEQLAENCYERCRMRGLVWGSPSPLDHADLIHRHSRRDRSGVIETRRKALAAKQQQRQK